MKNLGDDDVVKSQKFIYVNTRILSSSLTGVQRYLLDLSRQFDTTFITIRPDILPSGIMGHFWEQFILPFRIGGNLLLSPSNTGPLFYRNQILILHDIQQLDIPESLNPLFALFYQLLIPKLVKNVKHIITVSEFSKSRIVERLNVPSTKVTVIPNSVDKRFSVKSEKKINDMLTFLKLPSRKYILTVSSGHPRKNIPSLIHAWNLIKDALPSDLFLVIAGKLGGNHIFKDTIFPQSERIYFTGSVPDNLLPELYSGASIFCFLSLYEGFGIPLLEAMACGVPIIASNTTAIPEIVSNVGLLVNPLDIQEIASSIEQLYSSSILRTRLSRLGLERIKEFSSDIVSKRTIETIKLYL